MNAQSLRGRWLVTIAGVLFLLAATGAFGGGSVSGNNLAALAGLIFCLLGLMELSIPCTLRLFSSRSDEKRGPPLIEP
jgi:hypothetical protein